MLETVIAKTVADMDEGQQYDAQVKAFLANKEILARIMKSCVEEYQDCSISDIVSRYIEGTPLIDTAADREDAVSAPQIQGMNTEDRTSREGTVYYDVKFYALAPNEKGKLIKLIINVEAQKSDDLPYPIPTRGVYYCSRMLSAEKNTEFIKNEYQNIKKVYSIWICYSSPRYPNTMTRFRITQDDMIGHAKIQKKDYDLLQVILIRLGRPDKTEMGTILHMLDVIFSDSVNLDDKKEVLENSYGVPMTENIDEELSRMCNISQGIREKSLSEGMQKGMAEGLEKGMEKGMQKGKLEAMIGLARDGLISVMEACRRLDMPETEFRNEMNKAASKA